MTRNDGTEDQLVIAVRVQPRGSRSEICGVRDGRLRIKTTAAPSDGKANNDVARQLARAFAVPVSRIRLKSGATARNKTFIVDRPVNRPAWIADMHRRPAR